MLTPDQVAEYRAKLGISTLSPNAPKTGTTPVDLDSAWAEYDAKKSGVAPQASTAVPQKGKLQEFADTVSKPFETGANLLFGSTGQTVGKLITKGANSAANLMGKEHPFKSTPDSTPLDIAFTGIELYPGGGFVTDALKGLPGGKAVAEIFSHIPENLKAKAVKQYAEALGATKEGMKKLTKRVVEGTPAIIEKGVAGAEKVVKEAVPGLLDRKEIIPSLTKIQEKSAGLMSEAGQGIKNVEEAIPKAMKSATAPILEKLSTMKNKYIVEGKVVDRAAHKALSGVEDTIRQFGDQINTKSLIKVRRILDESVDAGGGFLKDKITKLSDKAEKGAADAIRNILAEDVPDLSKLNAEFNLWSNVNKIATETLKRKSTQTGGLFRAMTTLGGAITGFTQGQGIVDKLEKGALGAAAGQYLLKGLQSPLYKTLSAVVKNEIAEAIIKGSVKKAETIFLKAIGGVKNLLTPNQ